MLYLFLNKNIIYTNIKYTYFYIRIIEYQNIFTYLIIFNVNL